MGRGSAASTSKGGTGGAKGNGDGMVMECESEGLSEAQLTKLQKLTKDVGRLQSLLLNPTSQKNDVVSGGASLPTLVNGTGGNVATAVTQPLTNGTGMVGLQVPQFLLLQNGQMLATSATLPSTVQPTSSAAENFPSSSTQVASSVNHTANKSNSNVSTIGPRSVSSRRAAAAANKNMANINNAGDEIEFLRNVRVPRSTASTQQKTPSTSASDSGAGTSSTVAGSSGTSNVKGFPMLNVITRPKNTLSPAEAMVQRKDLDTKVKAVLVKSPQEFVEWLLSEGLIRTSQFCNMHQLNFPVKLRLGMFSDPKVLATSGGYVWISECCGKKYVSVFSGSIFGSTPIDKVQPTSVLKLIYHWSCQTSITNVESWVRVDRNFINKMYGYLRCVCSVMLQDKVYDFGFDGTTVELGIVSLGTSTADGSKKAVKVEILGLYDRKMKSFRLFASEPEPGSSSRQRFVRILKPLERVVHTNAIILCDQSVDRNCLYFMNYGKVSVCDTSDNEENLSSNAKIMSYLRRHVPKMFQSALSQLTLQQVQLVLDELCWRERYGHCAANAYNSMIEHITYLTAREAENPGVLHLLEFVAQEPHHSWRYKSQHLPKGPTALQPSIIVNHPSNAAIASQISIETNPGSQTPLDHTNKVNLMVKRIPLLGGKSPPMRTVQLVTTTKSSGRPENTPSISGNKAAVKSMPTTTTYTSEEPLELEPYYYGKILGDSSLGRDVCTHTFTCNICNEVCVNNIDFYTHLKTHLSRTGNSQYKIGCDYCLLYFPTEDDKRIHELNKHRHGDSRYYWCRICSETYQAEFSLISHMARKHCEAELPYHCEVCNFTTSFYHVAIDHFNKEHKRTQFIQCHYCLAVKTVNASSANTFSQRLFSHLQKHGSNGFKCKSCELSFYSRFLLEEHRKKDHIPKTYIPGLKRYKIPEGHHRIMFRPLLKTTTANPTLQTVKKSQPIMPSTIPIQSLNKLSFSFIYDDVDYYCIECDANLKLEGHYQAYVKCTRCAYATCCRNMLTKHITVFHPDNRKRRVYYNIGPPIVLPKPLFCICGFSSRSGNHLANHLVQCIEGGRKSAYRSVAEALEYRADHITGGAMSLATLGLANLIPSTSDAPDVSHFMSMSMDVDD